MKRYLLTIFSVLGVVCAAHAEILTVERGSDLQSVIDFASDGDTIQLGAKTFEARPRSFADPICGNCLDPMTPVRATTGFVIRRKTLTIIGDDRDRTQLVTKAGYGVYIEDCPAVTLRNFTVTGGQRDADGNATDAGIVVRNSRVNIVGVTVRDNGHRLDSVVVGIGGIFGREGAELTIRNCLIADNGWDGIALYRAATATVTDCTIRNGRGAGIGVTWDATCFAVRNDVSGYWKGIGAFGTSWVVARNNLVQNNLGWGMIATGQAYMDISNNLVRHNGNCGVAPWSTEARGRIKNNIIVANGWRDQWVCPCVGVWNYGDWAKWEFTNNIVWNNVKAEYEDIWDQTGLNGNISENPMFLDTLSFRLAPESPARGSGDSLIFNRDGSRSDMGLYGGPQARQVR